MLDAIRNWGPLFSVVVSVAALALGIANRRTQQREHRWKETDRALEAAKRGWCIFILRELQKERAKPFSTLGVVRHDKVAVPDDRREWARWGEEQGYFVVSYRKDGRMDVSLPEAEPEKAVKYVPE